MVKEVLERVEECLGLVRYSLRFSSCFHLLERVVQVVRIWVWAKKVGLARELIKYYFEEVCDT